MKKVIIFLWIIFFSSFLFAQQPSQKEINGQMQQVVTDTKKQIADLEKKITAAKANKESAQSIKGMETELESLKTMISFLDKPGSLNSVPATVNTKESVLPVKNQSPIITIPLKQPVQVPTEAQAKDRMLWYKGKKINDSILVTTKGMIVLFSKKRNLVITQPAQKTDPFIKLINNLVKSKQWTDDYINKESTKKKWLYELSACANDG